jgi:hypothetical protein
MKKFSFNMPDAINKALNLAAATAKPLTTPIPIMTASAPISAFRVSEPSKEKLKRIAGTEKAELAINDLNLTPEFSTGKTTLSFNLPAKTTADVKFTNTEGKVLWTDKATAGTFSKKISLPVNGVYYLQVKQGASVSVKKIIKE